GFPVDRLAVEVRGRHVLGVQLLHVYRDPQFIGGHHVHFLVPFAVVTALIRGPRLIVGGRCLHDHTSLLVNRGGADRRCSACDVRLVGQFPLGTFLGFFFHRGQPRVFERLQVVEVVALLGRLAPAV